MPNYQLILMWQCPPEYHRQKKELCSSGSDSDNKDGTIIEGNGVSGALAVAISGGNCSLLDEISLIGQDLLGDGCLSLSRELHGIKMTIANYLLTLGVHAQRGLL